MILTTKQLDLTQKKKSSDHVTTSDRPHLVANTGKRVTSVRTSQRAVRVGGTFTQTRGASYTKPNVSHLFIDSPPFIVLQDVQFISTLLHLRGGGLPGAARLHVARRTAKKQVRTILVQESSDSSAGRLGDSETRRLRDSEENGAEVLLSLSQHKVCL